MAINPVSVENYNGLSFLGSSSNKPIVGISTSVNRHTLSVARLTVSGTDIIVPGDPVKITNNASGTVSGAGKVLNPNVLKAEKITADTDISGFLLVNETDILESGEKAPYARNGQLVNVAIFGSLTELYLPADAGLVGANIGTKCVWDTTSGTVKSGTNGTIQVIGPVVDGLKFKADTTNNTVVYENCKVIKVRL